MQVNIKGGFSQPILAGVSKSNWPPRESFQMVHKLSKLCYLGATLQVQANHGLDGFVGFPKCTVSEPMGQNGVKYYEILFGHNMVDVCIIREGKSIS